MWKVVEHISWLKEEATLGCQTAFLSGPEVCMYGPEVWSRSLVQKSACMYPGAFCFRAFQSAESGGSGGCLRGK